MQRMFEELFALHPFFRSCPAEAAALINLALCGYIRSELEGDRDAQITVLNRICTTSYTGSFDVEWLLENSTAMAPDGHIFETLHELRSHISAWMLFTMDNTNPELAGLTGVQRTAVYSLIFGSEYTPLLETSVQKDILRPTALRQLSSELDFDDMLADEVWEDVRRLREDPSAAISESLKRVISTIGQITEDCECHTYVTHSLEDLLKLEVYNMSQEGVRIKRCKYCGRYFVLEKGNMEYCDRIAPGESRPCSEIGKTRTYEQRITGGNSAMALYRKAYKTHFARIRSGAMTRDEFEVWKAEAAQKRLLAENGEMDFEEYALWLKK